MIYCSNKENYKIIVRVFNCLMYETDFVFENHCLGPSKKHLILHSSLHLSNILNEFEDIHYICIRVLILILPLILK